MDWLKYINNFFGHLRTILVHKWWVFYYCCKFGIPYRGIFHDMSKFSPIEFWESVKYYSGTRSPIDASKEANGWSKAWLHHRGRNLHHYEAWQDNFDKGGEALCMPFVYNLEMLCDYLAAGRAYMKKNFSYIAEYNWWKNKCKNPLAMHPVNKRFIDGMLYSFATPNFLYVLKRNKDTWYDYAKFKYREAKEIERYDG